MHHGHEQLITFVLKLNQGHLDCLPPLLEIIIPSINLRIMITFNSVMIQRD